MLVVWRGGAETETEAGAVGAVGAVNLCCWSLLVAGAGGWMRLLSRSRLRAPK